ncbi:MAG: hypothetical protein AABX77_02890 [Nanoarchaeota archaeon]
MKYLIFDSGPLINFSMNGLLYLLESMHKKFNVDFLITKEIKEEVIDNPLNIKRFELEALRLLSLFKKGIIKHADLTKNEIDELRVIRNNLMQTANSTFKSGRTEIHLIDKGESAALALSIIMKKKTNLNIPLVIDERTTRILCEAPENLRKLFEKKLHSSIKANKNNYALFKDFKIIRSTEIAYIAYKNNLVDLKDPRALEAILYGLKLNGCSISEKEVEEMSGMRNSMI